MNSSCPKISHLLKKLVRSPRGKIGQEVSDCAALSRPPNLVLIQYEFLAPILFFFPFRLFLLGQNEITEH